MKAVHELIVTGWNRVNETLASQPKNVVHEKRILLYPEGTGRNFLQAVCFKLIWASCIVLSIWAIARFGGQYWKENSENAIYKDTYLWIYSSSGSKAREYLMQQLDEMRKDSIRENRIDRTRAFLERFPN